LGIDFDRKYGNYSSGMKGKLGFGFISHLVSDVLLVDETFSSGDMEFKRKAKQKMDELIKKAGTVIMCTHSMSLASQICTRAIVMESGYIAFEGDIREGLEFYKNLNKKLVNWIDFDMAGLSLGRNGLEMNLHEKFSIDEDLRLVIHDNSSNTFIHFEVLSKGELFMLKLEDLPDNPDCKVKLQQQRFGKWYDASKYIDIIPIV
jgi:ABC-type multidrug transport system ATPase subunit